jgi:hypothetical protein
MVSPPAFFGYGKNKASITIPVDAFYVFGIGEAVNFAELLTLCTKNPYAGVFRYKKMLPVRSHLQIVPLIPGIFHSLKQKHIVYVCIRAKLIP